LSPQPATTARAPLGETRGLMRVLTNSDLDEQKRRDDEDAAALSQPVVDNLAAHVRKVWERNKQAKLTIERTLARNHRQRSMIYEPEKLAAIKDQGGSEAFIGLTQKKCHDAAAWILDITMPAGDKPWGLEPTPLPELDPEVQQQAEQKLRQMAIQEALMVEQRTGQPVDVMQVKGIMELARKRMAQAIKDTLYDEAKERAERMEKLIEDQFVEGGFYEAYVEVIDDFVTFPAAHMKGPVIRMEKELKWAEGPGGPVPVVKTVPKKRYERLSPYYAFPDPDATTPNDGNFIELHRLYRKDFSDMLGLKGYKDEAIRQILELYDRGGLHEWLTTDSEKAQAEQRQWSPGFQSDKIDAIEMWGSVQGRWLIEWGMDPKKIPDPHKEYEVNVWMTGSIVFRCVLNPDPLGRRPYWKACFFAVPGAYWGRALPDTIADDQDQCNAAARAMINNMGFSSGPLYEVDVSRCENDDGEIYPWKRFESTSRMMETSPAVRFHNVPNTTPALLQVYDKFSLLADEHSGVPAYQQGNTDNVGGAGKTATGLSMLMNASARSIKGAIRHLDVGVVKGVVEQTYLHNMLFHPDRSVKGDLRATVRGSTALMIKEQMAIRRMEFAEKTNNPVDNAIMGMDGRRELLRGVAEAQDMDVDKIFPERPEQMPAPGGAPGQGGAPQTLDAAGNPVAGQDASIAQ